MEFKKKNRIHTQMHTEGKRLTLKRLFIKPNFTLLVNSKLIEVGSHIYPHLLVRVESAYKK